MAELRDKELNEVNGGWEEINPDDQPKIKAQNAGEYDIYWHVDDGPDYNLK